MAPQHSVQTLNCSSTTTHRGRRELPRQHRVKHRKQFLGLQLGEILCPPWLRFVALCCTLSLNWGASPELDSGFQIWPHQSRAEEQKNLPSGHPLHDAPQAATALGQEGKLLTHGHVQQFNTSQESLTSYSCYLQLVWGVELLFSHSEEEDNDNLLKMLLQSKPLLVPPFQTGTLESDLLRIYLRHRKRSQNPQSPKKNTNRLQKSQKAKGWWHSGSSL